LGPGHEDVEFTIFDEDKYLHCVFEGHPAATKLSWTKNGESISFVNKTEPFEHTWRAETYIKFSVVGTDTTGNYTCAAANKFNLTASKTFYVSTKGEILVLEIGSSNAKTFHISFKLSSWIWNPVTVIFFLSVVFYCKTMHNVRKKIQAFQKEFRNLVEHANKSNEIPILPYLSEYELENNDIKKGNKFSRKNI